MKKIVILFFIFGIILSSCCYDDEITLTRSDIQESLLRFDGVYYGETQQFKNMYPSNSLVFYINGIVYQGYGDADFDGMKEYIESHCDFSMNSRSQWGIIQMNNNEIIIEQWATGNCGCFVILNNGRILNDTTFVLDKRRITYLDEYYYEDISDTYRFIKTDCKPDSTNKYIK